MTMIQNRRDKILAYNSKRDCRPLRFSFRGDEKTIPERELKFNKDGSPNVYRLVISILEMCSSCRSINSVTDVLETMQDCNRSSLDIWRHAKYLYPDIDVFKIMEALHRLVREDKVYAQFCNQVKRTVFYLDEDRSHDMHFKCEEYNISFNTWRKLHED